MIFNLIQNLKLKIKLWNRARLERSRCHRVFKKEMLDISKTRNVSYPGKNFKKILIIESLFGLGDALYAHGLVKALALHGKEVTIATLKRTKGIYENSPYILKTYYLESTDDLDKAKKERYDIVLDLAYVGLDRWELRFPWLKEIQAWTVSCSNSTKASKIINENIDLSRENHVSSRMNKILFELTNINEKDSKIKPYIYTKSPVKKWVVNRLPTFYVNTLAREDDRCLSLEQIRSIANFFNEEKKAIAYFYIDKNLDVNINESDYVKIFQGKSITDLVEKLQEVDYVLTPDTSITHFSSVFNKPCIVLFCANEKDYFGNVDMAEVWAPLNPNSTLMYSKKSKSEFFKVSDISAMEIISAIKSFININ